MGGIPTSGAQVLATSRGVCFPIDACLGMPGLPQSGTGQATLLTGHNGAEEFGHHFGPWTPTVLRPRIVESGLLQRCLDLGINTCFANAYPTGYEKSRWFRRPAPIPFSAHVAGLIDKNWDDIAEGTALASSIVNTPIRERFGNLNVPDISPHQAGSNLARITARHEMTFFAHYDTDGAGHSGDPEAAVAALERIDVFLGGVLEDRDKSTAILVTSDHGNIESIKDGHTRNPVLGIWIPPLDQLDPNEPILVAPPTRIRGLEDVTPWVTCWLTGDEVVNET